MLAVALAVRFALELCLLGVFAWAAHRLAPGPAGVGLAVAAVVVVAGVWGTLLSPRRPVEIGRAPRLLLELILFGLAAGALYGGGHWRLAAALIAVELIDKLAIHHLEHRNGPAS